MKPLFLLVSSLYYTACGMAAALMDQQSLRHGQDNCLTQKQTELTISRLRDVLALRDSDLGNITETLDALLADDFASTADSYSMLAGNLWQVGKFNTTSKQQELATSKKPNLVPQVVFETTELATFHCNKIFWLWYMKTGNGKYPVRGMHYLTLNGKHQIYNLYTEVNGLADAVDKGFKINYPNGTALE